MLAEVGMTNVPSLALYFLLGAPFNYSQYTLNTLKCMSFFMWPDFHRTRPGVGDVFFFTFQMTHYWLLMIFPVYYVQTYSMTMKEGALLSFVLISYLLIGAVVFKALEAKHEQEQRLDVVKRLQEVDRMYAFSFTILLSHFLLQVLSLSPLRYFLKYKPRFIHNFCKYLFALQILNQYGLCSNTVDTRS